MARILVANSEGFRPASIEGPLVAEADRMVDKTNARAAAKFDPALKALGLAEGLATSKALGLGLNSAMRLGRFLGDLGNESPEDLRAKAAANLVAPKGPQSDVSPEMQAARAGDANQIAADDEAMAMAMMDDRFKRIQKGTLGTNIEDADTPADKMMDFRGVRPLSAEPARKLDANEAMQAQEARDRMRNLARQAEGLDPIVTATDRELAKDESDYGNARLMGARRTDELLAPPSAPTEGTGASPDATAAPAPAPDSKWPTRPVTDPTKLLLLARNATTEAKRQQVMEWAQDADVYGDSLADYASGSYKLKFAKQLADAMPKLQAEDDLRGLNIKSQIATREGQLSLNQTKREDALAKMEIQQKQHKDRMDGLYAGIRAANGRQARAIAAKRAADVEAAYQRDLDRQQKQVDEAIAGVAAASAPVSTKAYDATAQMVEDAKARVASAAKMREFYSNQTYVDEDKLKAQAAEERAAAAGLAKAQQLQVTELRKVEDARAASRGKGAKGAGVGVGFDPAGPNLPTLLAIRAQIQKDREASRARYLAGPKATPKPKRKKGK